MGGGGGGGISDPKNLIVLQFWLGTSVGHVDVFFMRMDADGSA